MTLYGLFGFTHGAAKVLTVMSPQGVGAALAAVEADEDVIVNADRDRLTLYMEKRAGALHRLIERHAIVVLDKTAWDAKKAELGDALFR